MSAWIDWSGDDDCPVPYTTRVDTIQRGHALHANVLAGDYAAGRWKRAWRGSVRDITKYRVVSA